MPNGGEVARVAGFLGEGSSYTACRQKITAPTRSTRGNIVFSYADSRTVTERIAVLTDDADNPNHGILLDERDFFGRDAGL